MPLMKAGNPGAAVSSALGDHRPLPRTAVWVTRHVGRSRRIPIDRDKSAMHPCILLLS